MKSDTRLESEKACCEKSCETESNCKAEKVHEGANSKGRNKEMQSDTGCCRGQNFDGPDCMGPNCINANLKCKSDIYKHPSCSDSTISSPTCKGSVTQHKGVIGQEWSVSFEQFLANVANEERLAAFFEKPVSVAEEVRKLRERCTLSSSLPSSPT